MEIKGYKKNKLCMRVEIWCSPVNLNKMIKEGVLIYSTGCESTEVIYLKQYDKIVINKDIVNIGRWILSETKKN